MRRSFRDLILYRQIPQAFFKGPDRYRQKQHLHPLHPRNRDQPFPLPGDTEDLSARWQPLFAPDNYYRGGCGDSLRFRIYAFHDLIRKKSIRNEGIKKGAIAPLGF